MLFMRKNTLHRLGRKHRRICVLRGGAWREWKETEPGDWKGLEDGPALVKEEAC